MLKWDCPVIPGNYAPAVFCRREIRAFIRASGYAVGILRPHSLLGCIRGRPAVASATGSGDTTATAATTEDETASATAATTTARRVPT